jgi:hypothetical protein
MKRYTLQNDVSQINSANITLNPLNAELNPICHLLILLGDLMFMGKCIVSIFQYISNKMQRYTVLFIYGNCSTCFGWYFHPSSGAHTTVSTTSGICHTFTAICRYRARVGTVLSVLWVAYGTHSTDGMMLTGGKPKYWDSSLSLPNLVHRK